MGIEILNVNRDGGKAKEVKILLDGYLELDFQKINGKIRIVSIIDYSKNREYGEERRIPKKCYEQVGAIFEDK